MPLINLRQAFRKKLENVFLETLNARNRNITEERQMRALQETVDYISDRMYDIHSFSSRKQVLEYASTMCKTDGLILEFGVYSGQTINIISSIHYSKAVYGFDSFEGLPDNWRDGYGKGSYKAPDLPRVNENVKLIKGWFNETLPVFLQEHPGDVAFLHVDCDLYSSTKTIFDNLTGRLKKGSVIVFDEYFNYPGWRNGEYKALQEFVAANNIRYSYLTYNNMHEQVAVIIEET